MHTLRRWITLISIVTMIVFMGLAGFTSLSKAQGGGTTTRVSVASDGTQGNNFSSSPSISSDGRYVTFYSNSNNLVPNDTNGANDIFVHDRQTGITSRISVAFDGTEGNGWSYNPTISANGQYVAFFSSSSNLVFGDTNDVADVFIHNLHTGTIGRVSIASDGTQGNSDSGSNASSPAISTDGRYVAFFSDANNLVLNDTNDKEDVFVYDLQTQTTDRVSVASNGTQGNGDSYYPSISADGRYVVFGSGSSNLVVGDTNNVIDVFNHDRQTKVTSRVSVASNGIQGDLGSLYSSISADGRYVAFNSSATNLVANDVNGAVDIFLKDRQTDEIILVSVGSDKTQGNGGSYSPSISADGRYVAFNSNASNLVVSDTNGAGDVFVHNYQTRLTSRVSVATEGTQGNDGSISLSISADGRYVAFDSSASNLVVNDTNENSDIFLREWGTLDHNVYIPISVRNYAFIDLPCQNQDSEPNNRFSEAVQKPLFCPDTQLTGTANRTNDLVDFFRIEVKQTGDIQIDLTNLPINSDFDLYLYNEAGVQKAVGNESGSQNEQIRFNAAQGYYFISVVPIVDDPNSATYYLRWFAE